MVAYNIIFLINACCGFYTTKMFLMLKNKKENIYCDGVLIIFKNCNYR